MNKKFVNQRLYADTIPVIGELKNIMAQLSQDKISREEIIHDAIVTARNKYRAKLIELEQKA